MIVPGMYEMQAVMDESSLSEADIFNLGIVGDIVFLVVVPELGACRVSDVVLSHFMAGESEYAADKMPEHWTGQLSGKWTIQRDRLRILANSWESHLESVLSRWEPKLSPAAPAPVETIEQRRARYLAWHTEEMSINPRGAVQRVFEREAKLNPKADRANIGKDIRKARDVAKTKNRDGSMFGQLVRDGKRQN